MGIENKTVGRNIARFRRLRDLKASEVAERLGLKEAAYTKYERGETSITMEHLNKIGEILEIDPLQIISASAGTFFENINSPVQFVNGSNSTLNTYNEQQANLTLKLLESVIDMSRSVTEMNQRLISMIDKKKD
jgi:transcriptional regulator with XRE-family HTH domain